MEPIVINGIEAEIIKMVLILIVVLFIGFVVWLFDKFANRKKRSLGIMIFRTLIVKMFVCRCNTNYGVRHVRQYSGNNIVGRCLKCDKRVYGKIIYDPNKDLSEAKDGGNHGK